MAFGCRLDGVREHITMRPGAQRAVDMHGFPAHATQCIEIEIEPTVDFPLMARAKEMHERHAAAPVLIPRCRVVNLRMSRM